jgi:hypothetical protein
LAEFESTRALLKFWQRQVNSMAWNTEDGAIEDKSNSALLTIRFWIEFAELKPLGKNRNLQKVS